MSSSAAAEPLDTTPSVSALLARASAKHLAHDRTWQVLLHYRPALGGGWRSEADGDGFFLAGAAGRTNPEAELEAAVRVLFTREAQPSASVDLGAAGTLKDAPDLAHPQCRFPARWRWLKAELAPEAGASWDVPCPSFATWRQGIAPTAVTLVYATAFLNSPASMYGHTFLRLSRATGEGNPLLDYVINFAADVDTKNGLVYAMKGLSGGFAGLYYVMPYYLKVQEYSNLESRDLWDYELVLAPAEIERLVEHVWETRSTYFAYYFFTRNCSYQLLALLEAARPSLHLVETFGSRVIPADTIRTVLAQAGLVTRVSPRTSLLSVMRARKRGLTSGELAIAERLALSPLSAPLPQGDLAQLPAARAARVLDTADDYLRYSEGLAAEPTLAFKNRERRLLLARGRLGQPPQEAKSRPTVDEPTSGHRTLRLSVGAGIADQSGPFQTLAVRGTLHDYLDRTRGYSPDAQLVMGQVTLRFVDRRHEVGLLRADLLDITSAAPLERWVKSFSWRVWAGVENAHELGCDRAGADRAGWRCLYAGVLSGGGLAVRAGRLLLLALLETEVATGPAFAPGAPYRLGGGGELLLVGDAGARWRLLLGARGAGYLLGDRRVNLRSQAGVSFSFAADWQLRATVNTAGTWAAALLELNAYF